VPGVAQCAHDCSVAALVGKKPHGKRRCYYA
jgi:hypothetical protein